MIPNIFRLELSTCQTVAHSHRISGRMHHPLTHGPRNAPAPSRDAAYPGAMDVGKADATARNFDDHTKVAMDE